MAAAARGIDGKGDADRQRFPGLCGCGWHDRIHADRKQDWRQDRYRCCDRGASTGPGPPAETGQRRPWRRLGCAIIMRRRSPSLRQTLMLITGALTLMITLLAAKDIYGNWVRLTNIQTLQDTSVLSDRLFDATERL